MREHEGTPALTLRRWLAARTSSERATMARLWSLPEATAQAPDTLAEAMLQPAVVARLLSSLGPRERAALARVQEHGGDILAPVLEREFGAVRAHDDYPNPRAYLLALEQPPSPTERLYMLALVQQAGSGPQRVYTIPPDLLALLPPVPERDPTPRFPPAGDPPEVAEGEARFVEQSLLTILALARDGQLEVIPTGGLNKASLVRLARQWNKRANLQGISREEHWPYIQFLRRIAQGAGLLHTGADARLRPTREALAWLRQPALERARRLLDGWVVSEWDELASFAGVKVQRSYFRDLSRAKRAILRLLGHAPPGHWIALDAFAAAIKEADPDFARPDGRYDTWGLVSYLRQPLDGFEHWDEVEGQQLRSIAGGTLRWLGLTDLGLRDDAPVSFRVNALGAALLGSGPAPAEAPDEPLVVQPNFEVIVPAYASPYARFQLSRIAERIGGDDTEIYKLTKRSSQAALEQGVSLEDMLRLLGEQSGHEPPQNVVATLREWAGQHSQVTLRRSVLLEAEPALLEQIKRDKRVKLPQVERLADSAWLVREGDAPALAGRLRKAGYGLTGDADAPNAPLSEHDLTVLFAALECYAHTCAALGIESDASGAMRQRIARLLPERQLNRAYQSSHDLIRRLKERLG
jgi:hypothetical protein